MESKSNFLRKYVSLFEGTEVPERFALWAGISCLSAMLERRIWIDMNIFTIYPNMFIIFVADSGTVRKSTAIDMTENLLSKTDPGPNLIAHKITPEALIDALQTVRSDDPSILLKETCGGMVVADELVTFLNKDSYDRGLGSFCIKMWDCPNRFEYRTRNKGMSEINYGHLSLLGGATIHTLRESLPIQSLGDGFSSRVIFVYEDIIPPAVPRPVQLKGFKKIEQDLIQHLQTLANLKGEVIISQEAGEFFDEEYIRFRRESRHEESQFVAYASRRDKHLLKVAMCLMAAEGEGMTIETHHLQGAKILLEEIEAKMQTVFDRIVMTEVGALTEAVLAAIRNAGREGISRVNLLKKFSHRLSAYDVGKIVIDLKNTERIEFDTDGGELMYKAVEQ